MMQVHRPRRWGWRAGRVALFTLALAWGLAPWGALRADDTAVAQGRALAEKNCGRCHALGRTGESPLAIAPPFRIFAERWPLESLEEALAEGIVTGHPDMPEFVFTPEEIGHLIAFLASLGNGNGGGAMPAR